MTEQEIRENKLGKLDNTDLLNEVKFYKSRRRYEELKKNSNFKNIKLKPL